MKKKPTQSKCLTLRVVGRGDAQHHLYRFNATPSQRRAGYRSLDLWGAPGPALTDAEWKQRGFASAPTPLVRRKVKGSKPLPIADAVKAADAILAAMRDQTSASVAGQGNRSTAQRFLTLNAVLDAFLADKANPSRRTKKPVAAKTLDDYRLHLQKTRTLWGDLSPLVLSKDLLEAAYDSWHEANGPNAADHAIRVLRNALNWAQGREAFRGQIPDPTMYSRLDLTTPEGRIRCGTPDEVAAMLRAFDDPVSIYDEAGTPPAERRLKPSLSMGDALIAMLWTCARVRDALELTDQAPDFDAGTLMYRQSKGGKVVTIPMLGPLSERLHSALRRRRAMVGDRYPHLIVCEDDQRPYGRISRTKNIPHHRPFADSWRTYRQLAGVIQPSLLGEGMNRLGEPNTPLRAQDCRDTGITRLFDAGASLAEIAVWHGAGTAENMAAIAKHYIERNPEAARVGGERLMAFIQERGISI